VQVGAADRARGGQPLLDPGLVGTALLASVFYRVLSGSGHAYPTVVSDALLCACVLMLLALLLAIAELWHRRRSRVRMVHGKLYAQRLLRGLHGLLSIWQGAG